MLDFNGIDTVCGVAPVKGVYRMPEDWGWTQPDRSITIRPGVTIDVQGTPVTGYAGGVPCGPGGAGPGCIVAMEGGHIESRGSLRVGTVLTLALLLVLTAFWIPTRAFAKSDRYIEVGCGGAGPGYTYECIRANAHDYTIEWVYNAVEIDGKLQFNKVIIETFLRSTGEQIPMPDTKGW